MGLRAVNSHDQIEADYAAWMRSWGASPQTIRARRVVAAGRLREWGLDGFTPENARAWLGRDGLSRWTRATYHAHLSDFCAWLAACELIADNPMEDMRKPGRPHSLPRPLTEADVDRVLEAAKGRTRDWIMLALYAGLRAHEVAKIRGEDVTPDSIYVEGKGGVRASLPTHPELWSMALRYPQRGWWFPSVQTGGHISAATVSNYVGELFRSLGISGSIHRCRHVYGTRLLRAGVNVRQVQKLMRHASLDTTAVYTAVDEDELRAAINLLGPSHPAA